MMAMTKKKQNQQGKKKIKERKKKKKGKNKHKHQITCNLQHAQQYAKQSNVKGRVQGLQSLILHKK
jgi:hypothetical protein